MKLLRVLLKTLLKRLKIRTNVVVMKINTICPGILKQFTVTYRVYVKTNFICSNFVKCYLQNSHAAESTWKEYDTHSYVGDAPKERSPRQGMYFLPKIRLWKIKLTNYVIESHIFFLTTLKLQKQSELHSRMVNDTATTFRTWLQRQYIIPNISIWTRLLSPWVCLLWALI